MDNVKQRGETTEAIVLAELMKRGIPVLRPFGENHRYDFVLDLADEFIRLQCKTGRYRDGTVRFTTISTRPRGTGYSKEGYHGDVDYFVVYVPELEQAYLIPIDDVSKNEMYLRVEPPANNQTAGINWASEFELEDQLERVGWETT